MILPRVGKETHQNTPAAFKCGKQGISPAPPFSPPPKALLQAYSTKRLEKRKIDRNENAGLCHRFALETNTSPSRENDVLGRGLLRIEKGRADQEQGAWR